MKSGIIFTGVSLLLYITAPDDFNWLFCIACCLVFLFEAIITLLPDLKKGNYLSFNLVFFFSYFWTSFAYPVLIYGTTTDRSNIINKAINWDYLSHTSALALLFISLYMWGYSTAKMKSDGFIKNEVFLNPPKILYGFFFLLFIAVAILSAIITGRGNMVMGKYLIDIYFSLLIIYIYVNIKNNSHKNTHNIKNFIKVNKQVIIGSAVLLPVFLVIGDRGPIIKTVLILFSAFYFFGEKISIRKLSLYGVFFLMLLFFVRQTRSSDNGLGSENFSAETVRETFDLENGVLYMFADLFYINRELCLGYEYAQSHELFHPERILLAPLNPIPLLPSVVSTVFFDATPAEMDTGMELNKQVSDFYDLEGHFGNHPASDLLMSFGLLGLTLIVFVFGRMVGSVCKNTHSGFYTDCVFLALMSWSLYVPRSYILILIRPVGYIFIIGYLLYRIPISRSRYHINKSN